MKGEGIFLQLAKAEPNQKFIYFSRDNKRYALSNVEYGGWASSANELFGAMDLLIVPSVWSEPFGRIAPEAISSGLPVLVSDKGGLPETVDPFFHVSGEGLGPWREALQRIIDSPDASERAWLKSRSMLENFSEESHCMKIEEIFGLNCRD